MEPLVSISWLAKNLHREDVKLLDGTWIMPGENPSLPAGYIPGAQFFDIDVIADTQSAFKHMLPNAGMFSQALSDMGIKASDTVILYDRHGVRTSPRLWWTFRMFGHANLAVLDGGLPAWINAGHQVSNEPTRPEANTNYTTSKALSGVITQNEILAQLDNSSQIADARPQGRFYGTQPEPRTGLKSGHIPGSFSLPYGELQTHDGHLKPLSKIAEIVGHSGIDITRPIITTCGSGITAAGIAFNLYRLGAKDIRLYDASWTEWGASDAPISLEN